jgi:lipoprotein-releasing system permease protein
MNLPLFIASRYYRSKKTHHVINIITRIAMVGVAVGSMALIVVLSAFNGIENLVISLFNAFDPDIKIVPAEGKSFSIDDLTFEQIKSLPGVIHYSEVIEENALLKFRDKQHIATIKAVSENFVDMSRLDTMIIDGEFALEKEGIEHAVLGQGLASNLGVHVSSYINPIHIYLPRRKGQVSLNPEQAFKQGLVYPAGIFSIQHDFDSKFMIVPIHLARELLEYDNMVTSIELGIDKKKFRVSDIQGQIQEILGARFLVKDRFQQHDFLYKIMKTERWAVYLILTLILIIATFNVTGSLTMLIIDKKQDILILKNLGAETSLIKKIFFLEGLMISVSGAIAGLSLGFLICILQIKFEIIKLQGSFVMEAYPVKLIFWDFIWVFLTVLLIGSLASWFPARQVSKAQKQIKQPLS